MDLFRRKAVDFPFGDGDAMEYGNGFVFDPMGKAAGRDQLLDFREIAAV